MLLSGRAPDPEFDPQALRNKNIITKQTHKQNKTTEAGRNNNNNKKGSYVSHS